LPNLFHTLLVGILWFLGISGLGRLLILRVRRLPLHWYAAIAVLTEIALSSLSVQCLAIIGSGRTGFRTLGVMIVVLGVVGHALGRGRYCKLPLPRSSLFRTSVFGLLCLLVLILTPISIAPSTKIDETRYHMLVGRRVLEDGGLRVYQLPVEQASSRKWDTKSPKRYSMRQAQLTPETSLVSDWV
jgi:hypothetical protein